MIIGPWSIILDENLEFLPDATIMTAGDKVESVLVHGETGDSVQMGHHTVHHGARVVVVEPAAHIHR